MEVKQSSLFCFVGGIAVVTLFCVFHMDVFVSKATTVLWIPPSPDRAPGPLEDELTVVTAYVDIGGGKYGQSTYEGWMRAYTFLENPVHAFFDNPDIAKTFLAMRRKRQPENRTHIEMFNKSDMWSFQILNESEKLVGKKALYDSAMHAKFEVMVSAARQNRFGSRYIAWFDLGYFRRIANDTSPLYLWLPPDFNSSSIAYGSIKPRNASLSPTEIIRRNAVWLVGGLFIGEVTLIERWTQWYREAVYGMLYDHQLMGTDQHVLYFMVNTMGERIAVQEYHGSWFSFGYRCLREGEKRKANITPPRH